MGNPNQTCLATCQQNDAVCIDKLQTVFDTCDYHEIIDQCHKCENGKSAGFVSRNSESSDKICIKLAARSKIDSLCVFAPGKNIQPLCACQMVA